MQSLRGKVALITGASSGIGAAIAEYFANQGARLSLAGRKPDNLHDVASKTNLGRSEILTTVGDMVRVEDRRELVTQTMDKFGQLDILVNNAGIVYRDLFEDLPEDHYDSIMNINLKAPVLLTKLAIPHLVKSKELGPRGVRVNAVNPGFTLSTNILHRSNIKNAQEIEENYGLNSSLRRSATPEEIAKVAAFLASDLASFVTGELLYADGGLRLRN